MAGWLGSMVATAFIGAIALVILILAVVLILNGNRLGIFVAVVAGFLVVMFTYVLRDTRGKVGWHIAIGATALDLDLPRGRSLIHRLDPVHSHICFDEIEAIETRLEAYSSLFGLTNMHRVYALKLKTGDVIILGEDRALHTAFESSILSGAVGEIIRQSHLELRDFGMAQGQSGFLTVLFASPPRWDAPSLSSARQAELWAAAEWTGRLAEKAAFVASVKKSR